AASRNTSRASTGGGRATRNGRWRRCPCRAPCGRWGGFSLPPPRGPVRPRIPPRPQRRPGPPRDLFPAKFSFDSKYSRPPAMPNRGKRNPAPALGSGSSGRSRHPAPEVRQVRGRNEANHVALQRLAVDLPVEIGQRRAVGQNLLAVLGPGDVLLFVRGQFFGRV